MEALLILTNLPDEESATSLARHLVEERLVACANILAHCNSVYRWEGKVAMEREVPLLLKTTRAAYPALEKAIISRHPYELPEIVAVPIAHGLPAYLDWIATETRPLDTTSC